jgi:uncharacterized protein (DUF885 family)
MLNRRQALGAAVGAAALASGVGPALAESADGSLRRLLDGMVKRGASGAERAAALTAFPDLQRLSATARLDYDAVLQASEIEAEFARRFPFGAGPGAPYGVTTRAGNWLKAAEAIKAGGDAPAALARKLDAETARVRADAADHGVVPPAFVIDKVLGNLTAAARDAPADLAAALARQGEALASLRAKAGAVAGLGRFPWGREYYALVLKQNLGMAIDPDEAHQRGLAAVQVFAARAARLLDRQGVAAGPLGDRFAALAGDPRWLYGDDEAGRDRLVADMVVWLEKAKSRLSRSFSAIPPGTLTARISRMSRADEAAARQGYRDAPNFDGGRAGVYYVDLVAIRRRPSWTLPSVVHHEAVPGHMLQIPLEEGSGAHPLRTRLACPGFLEGWAIYAEQRADEEGAFQGDPLAELGYLQWMLFRAGRLVVDTGLHVKGWTRERAEAWFARIQGPPPVFAPIAQDVERAAIGPGAMAGQGLAWLEIVRLREAIRRRPGFDLKRFHADLLLPGTLPFSTQRRRLLAE